MAVALDGLLRPTRRSTRRWLADLRPCGARFGTEALWCAVRVSNPGPADVAKVLLNVRLQSGNRCSDLAVLTCRDGLRREAMRVLTLQFLAAEPSGRAALAFHFAGCARGELDPP
jgi:hypothetical protein